MIASTATPLGNQIGRTTLRFDDFYRSHYHPAIRLAWLLTRSPQAAEDAVQEAFLALSRRFDVVEEPGPYLHRTIVYQCRSWVRRERLRRQRETDVPERWQEMDLPDAQLLAAVHRLPYRQRVVIVARYWADWSEADIACALGCRQGTVKSLSSRALSQLRKEVGDDPDRA